MSKDPNQNGAVHPSQQVFVDHPSQVNDPSTGAVQDVLERHGSPYNIEVEQIFDISDIASQPEIQRVIEENCATLITSGDIERLAEGIPEGPGFNEAFMAKLAEEHPEVASGINHYIDRSSRALAAAYKDLSLEQARAELESRFIGGLVNDDNFSTVRIPQSYSAKDDHSTFHGEVPYINFPDSHGDASWDYKSSLHQRIVDYLGDKGGITNPPPGTNEEWAALIAVHETEHLEHDQSSVNEYFQAVRTDPEMKTTIHAWDKNVGHAREIESDMSAARNLATQVSPEVFEYWTATRMVCSMQGHMAEGLKRANGMDIYGIDSMNVSDIHDTSFHIDEYLQTGEIPDYCEITQRTNSFYDKTAAFMIHKIEGHMDSTGNGNMFDAFQEDMNFYMDPPTAGEMVTMIREALMADPPIYTPAEQVMAQRFIDSMEGTLGVEPTTLDNMYARADATLNAAIQASPENTNEAFLIRDVERAMENMGTEMSQNQPATMGL